MEIDASHKGDGATFAALVRHFLSDAAFADCMTIRCHINSKNTKSQAVFTHLGFTLKEKTARGAKYVCGRGAIKRYINGK
jgi:RimJ/RimL family protein N-acetyltransferase